MNKKETELHRIVSLVIGCCATQIDDDGKMSLTKEDVLGKSRKENVVMTRCILVEQILKAGYSTTTAAQLLHRSVNAIRHLMVMGDNYCQTSRAYRIAREEAYTQCRINDIQQ